MDIQFLILLRKLSGCTIEDAHSIYLELESTPLELKHYSQDMIQNLSTYYLFTAKNFSQSQNHHNTRLLDAVIRELEMLTE